MNMSKLPDETLKQGRNRSWLLVKIRSFESSQKNWLLKCRQIFVQWFTSMMGIGVIIIVGEKERRPWSTPYTEQIETSRFLCVSVSRYRRYIQCRKNITSHIQLAHHTLIHLYWTDPWILWTVENSDEMSSYINLSEIHDVKSMNYSVYMTGSSGKNFWIDRSFSSIAAIFSSFFRISICW